MPQGMAVVQKRFAAALAVAMILCAATPVFAQRTRAWAGATATPDDAPASNADSAPAASRRSSR
jgi:hypothetical protein